MIELALSWAATIFYAPFSYMAGVLFTIIFFLVLMRYIAALYSR